MLTDNEIRLKIAELKGWRVYDVNLDYRVEKYMGTSPEGVFYAVLPDWPTDIAAAWEMVEEIKAAGIWFMMGNPDFNPDAAMVHGWWAKLYLPDDDTGGIEIEQVADTAARAICLAWLTWKEVEVG